MTQSFLHVALTRDMSETFNMHDLRQIREGHQSQFETYRGSISNVRAYIYENYPKNDEPYVFISDKLYDKRFVKDIIEELLSIGCVLTVFECVGNVFEEGPDAINIVEDLGALDTKNEIGILLGEEKIREKDLLLTLSLEYGWL